MQNSNEFDNIDQEFDSVIDTNQDNADTNNDNITNNGDEDEKLETLDDLIKSEKETKEQKTDKIDKEVNNIKQNNEQQTNKSKGNNNSQDLLDKDGNIIAKAGAERRFYEENVRLKKDRDNFNQNILPRIKQEYDEMANRINAYNETFKSLQMGDLSTEDINLGLELIRQWKKSPKDTINFLLTQAKSYGIDDISDEDKSKINMSAINQMLDQKLQPLLQQRENEQRQIQARMRAKNIYNNFISKYPDAQNHVNELAYMFKKSGGNEPLDAIYYRLKNYYLENGYDFNTPLAEILKQKQQQRNTFNGINVNQNIKTANIQTPIARANDSFDNIIRDAMKSVKK